VGALSKLELRLLAREARLYSLQFYIWKKQFLLRKNWLIFRKTTCPVCGSKVRRETTGARKRRSFFCPVCQKGPKRTSAAKTNARILRARLADVAIQFANLQKETPTITTEGGVEFEH
jgi:endonuclease-8